MTHIAKLINVVDRGFNVKGHLWTILFLIIIDKIMKKTAFLVIFMLHKLTIVWMMIWNRSWFLLSDKYFFKDNGTNPTETCFKDTERIKPKDRPWGLFEPSDHQKWFRWGDNPSEGGCTSSKGIPILGWKADQTGISWSIVNTKKPFIQQTRFLWIIRGLWCKTFLI